jgi:hypothetical protein
MIMRKRTALLATILACLGTTGAFVGTPIASAVFEQWTTNHRIGSGENVFGPRVELYESATEPTAAGVICSGIRFYGLNCPPGNEDAFFELSSRVVSEPYAHDHSTFASAFDGFYWD